ncbi:MAG: S-layer homology domain-containing protein, partial [Oscillospiraceae bacterium]
MRNLKKVLSLTLALVMMLGMMTFAGAAEAKKMTLDDFKDKADITKVDAVRLMVDLGILGGDENGNFAPKAAIERAAMAKLVYTAKMGTADATNLAGAGKFTDVAANHWASGYINYCASTKIIAGVTEVTFQPSAKVTTAAAAKML